MRTRKAFCTATSSRPTSFVTEIDGAPVPKVIDFGIAKATDQQNYEHTAFTQFGQFVGTPEYMSPEAADLVGGGVDTTSDVYSLGVLLYELLVGAVPFDGQALRKAWPNCCASCAKWTPRRCPPS
jgi:serine/threonine protein kinase